MHLPYPLLAEFSNIPWIAIIAIGGGMTLTAIIVIFGLQFAQRRQQMWHETARIALEKGQPLPQAPADMQPHSAKPERTNDLRSGLILIAVGAGLYLFLGTLFGRALGYVGAIPGFIGVALLIYPLFNGLFGSKKQPPADRN